MTQTYTAPGLKNEHGIPYCFGESVEGYVDQLLYDYEPDITLSPAQNLSRMAKLYWDNGKKSIHLYNRLAWPGDGELIKKLGVTQDEIDSFVYNDYINKHGEDAIVAAINEATYMLDVLTKLDGGWTWRGFCAVSKIQFKYDLEQFGALG